MFKLLRRLNLPLAAKCQILFGAAVLLILAAALYVPWQRMEQLMEQINERTARTLAEWAEADHIARQMAVSGATRPASGPSDPRPAPRPATLPAMSQSGSVREQALVKLVLFSKAGDSQLTRFETRAIREFAQDPEAEPMYRRGDTKEGHASFRYARALYARPRCLSCHEADLPADTRPGATRPAAESGVESGTSDSSRSAVRKPPLLGMVSIEIPYQVDANQIFLNRLFIAMAGVLGVTMVLLVFYFITSRFILRPVRVLQETAEKVSEGNLNIRSDISTGDEFQMLSETFNKMLINLKEGEDQLRAINQALDRKLGELAESNLALYESNRLKSEFLANVSHELKTPLNSILGFADLLKDAPTLQDPRQARYVQNIINSGRSLLDLISDLLDLAKIEAGRMEVRSEKLSLSDLFEGLVSILKPLAEKKEIALETFVGTDVPIMETDGGKLQQVLYNFLSNAIKFSPQGGRIDLRAERAGEEQVRLSVSDQGPGIDAEKHALIFEKFRQVDQSMTRQHGGTGLGLSISKELTALIGGRIGVESTPGHGATFWIMVPLKIAPAQHSLGVMVENK